jgi:hypothetical protein
MKKMKRKKGIRQRRNKKHGSGFAMKSSKLLTRLKQFHFYRHQGSLQCNWATSCAVKQTKPEPLSCHESSLGKGNTPWRTIVLWDVEAPAFSLDNRFTDSGKVVSLMSRPPFIPQEYSRYSFLFRGWVDPRAIVRLEGLGQLKKMQWPHQDLNPLTSGL